MRSARIALLTALSLWLSVTAFPASAGQLSVAISDIRNSKGYILVAIYDNKASFLDLPLARILMKFKAPPAQIHFALPDLAPGRYAITVVHDENNNGLLDKNILGIPTEGYGFSNGLHGVFALPDFDAAAIEFAGQDKAVDIVMHY